MNVHTSSMNQTTTTPTVDIVTEVLKKIVVIMDIIRPVEHIPKYPVVTDLKSSLSSCAAQVSRLEATSSLCRQGLGSMGSHLASCSSFSHGIRAISIPTATVVDTATVTQTLTETLTEMATTTFIPESVPAPHPHSTLSSAICMLLPYLHLSMALVLLLCTSPLPFMLFKQENPQKVASILFFALNILALSFIGQGLSKSCCANISPMSTLFCVNLLSACMLMFFVDSEASSVATPEPLLPHQEEDTQGDGNGSAGHKKEDFTPSQHQPTPPTGTGKYSDGPLPHVSSSSQAAAFVQVPSGSSTPLSPEPEDIEPEDIEPEVIKPKEVVPKHTNLSGPITNTTPPNPFPTPQQDIPLPASPRETQRDPFEEVLLRMLEEHNRSLASNVLIYDETSSRSSSPDFLASSSSSFSHGDEDGFSVIDLGEAGDRSEGADTNEYGEMLSDWE